MGIALRDDACFDARRTIVVPMPMPWQRRLYRRIDHAGLIAEAVARVLRVRVYPLLTVSNGPPQVSLSASRRRSRRAVRMRLRARLPRLDGVVVVLIDDVRTSGGSLNAAARLLRRLGPRLVVAGVLAVSAAAALTANTLAADKTEESKPQANASKDERFFMLNVLWFKPDGGAEKYDEYLKAAGPFVAKHGGKSDGAYVPEANIIGKFDADLVFFVEWPNKESFTAFIRDPGYRAVSHLRKEAIRDSLQIRCKKKMQALSVNPR